MHYAYPPRKDSAPPRFVPARQSRFINLRRSRAKLFAVAGLFFIALFYLLTRGGGSRHSTRHAPSGKPPVVIVTVIDEEDHYSAHYLESVRENRIQYAEKHGTRATRWLSRVDKLLIPFVSYRLQDILPESRRLRTQGRAILLDQGCRDAPRLDQIPGRDLHLVS